MFSGWIQVFSFEINTQTITIHRGYEIRHTNFTSTKLIPIFWANGGPRPSIFELELPLSKIYFNHSNYRFELRKTFFSFQQISLKGSSSSSIDGLGSPLTSEFTVGISWACIFSGGWCIFNLLCFFSSFWLMISLGFDLFLFLFSNLRILIHRSKSCSGIRSLFLTNCSTF